MLKTRISADQDSLRIVGVAGSEHRASVPTVISGSRGTSAETKQIAGSGNLGNTAPEPTPSPFAQPALRPSASQERQTSNFSGFSSANIHFQDAGGLQWSKYLTGLVGDNDHGLIASYRDCFHFDSVCGAAIEMQSRYPFSDYDLIGIPSKQRDVYAEACARIDARATMETVSLDHLVDGASLSTLVHDPAANSFQDLMIHDYSACKVIESPFLNVDPVIKMGANPKLNAFLNSDSPFLETVLSSYPKAFLNAFSQGGGELDPLSTIYIPRRGTRDQNTVSYLRRVLPAYLLEKTLFRGTLIEAQRRLRPSSLVTVGTKEWTATAAEMTAILHALQDSDNDPLGSWIMARTGVEITDIRDHKDFWKWTDIIEIMIPYKLRALGISEAFLSGEAAYATSEVAMTVYTENAAAYRSFLTHRFFKSKMFPLIAVINGFYRDHNKVDKGHGAQAVIRNIRNISNLLMPEIRWRKNLDNRNPEVFEMLEKLGEKGMPIPLKMWAASCNVSLDMLLGDLAEDQAIRDMLQQATGVRPDDTINSQDHRGGKSGYTPKPDPGYSHQAGNPGGVGDFGNFQAGSSIDEARRQLADLEFKPLSSAIQRRRVPLLSRSFVYPDGTPMDEVTQMSRSGKVVHAVLNQKGAKSKMHEQLAKAAHRLSDPQHYAKVKASLSGKMPQANNLIGG